MKSNIAIRSLLNIFGATNKLKFERDKPLNIYRIPNHYPNFKKLSLYFGDWRRVKSDCVYVKSRKDLDKLLVLSKMANFDVPKELRTDVDSEEGLIECVNYIKNCKFIYFGSLINFVPNDDLKSLLIPLDLMGNNSPSDLDSIKHFINSLENTDSLDKILLCTNDNETWVTHHKILKYK